MPTSSAASIRAFPGSRIRWGRVCAGIMALVLSTGLHALLIETFPELPVGRLLDVPVQRSLAPMRLGEVRVREATGYERPERLDPRDFEQRVDLAASARMAAAEIAELPPLAEVARELLAGAGEAVAQPERELEREAWEPRRDLLQIETPVHAEEVAALPRRLVATPDLSAPPPPIEGALERALEALPGLRQEAEGLAAPTLAPPVATIAGVGAVPLPEAIFDAPSMPPAPMDEETDALAEAIAAEPEVAPFEGVEHLLELELLAFRGADEPEYTYFELRIRRAPDAELPVLPRDIVLLVDGSQSMTQRTINSIKPGLKAIVDSLSEQDRFEILTFRETVYGAFGELRPATLRNKAEARTFIDRLVAQGRTDIDAGLDVLQVLDFQDARPAIVFLVTDGRPTAGVVNSSQIIQRFTEENEGHISVFSLGVGRLVNRFLLDLLSFRNRGDMEVIEENRRISGALREMHYGVSRPVLSDLRFRFSGVSDGEIYPRILTHLYLDRPLTVVGRFAGASPSAAVQIVGNSGDRQMDMVFPLQWETAAGGDSRLRQRWAWQKIYDLIGLHLQTGDEAVLEEMHALAERYGLRVPYGRDEVYLY